MEESIQELSTTIANLTKLKEKMSKQKESEIQAVIIALTVSLDSLKEISDDFGKEIIVSCVETQSSAELEKEKIIIEYKRLFNIDEAAIITVDWDLVEELKNKKWQAVRVKKHPDTVQEMELLSSQTVTYLRNLKEIPLSKGTIINEEHKYRHIPELDPNQITQ